MARRNRMFEIICDIPERSYHNVEVVNNSSSNQEVLQQGMLDALNGIQKQMTLNNALLTEQHYESIVAEASATLQLTTKAAADVRDKAIADANAKYLAAATAAATGAGTADADALKAAGAALSAAVLAANKAMDATIAPAQQLNAAADEKYKAARARAEQLLQEAMSAQGVIDTINN